MSNKLKVVQLFFKHRFVSWRRTLVATWLLVCRVAVIALCSASLACVGAARDADDYIYIPHSGKPNPVLLLFIQQVPLEQLLTGFHQVPRGRGVGAAALERGEAGVRCRGDPLPRSTARASRLLGDRRRRMREHAAACPILWLDFQY